MKQKLRLIEPTNGPLFACGDVLVSKFFPVQTK